MGISGGIQSPSEVARCEDPAISATLPCASCWSKDYTKEIQVYTGKRYSDQLNVAGESYDYNFGTVQYKLKILCKTKKIVVVEIRFKIESDDAVNDSAVAQAKKSLTEGVKKYWGNQFLLKISDPKCGTQILPIEFKVLFVNSDEHYIFKIHDKYDREGVTGNVLDVSKDTGPWTYAHEFGHCYGLPDEYGYNPDAEDNDQVVYYKPDRSLDSPISVPYNGGDPSDPASTIMAAYGNTIILKRHGWIIAIEANEIFNERGLGRRIICDIV